MIRSKFSVLGGLVLSGLAAHAAAQAQPDAFTGEHDRVSATALLAQNSLTPSATPNDNAIRRINPNSRQGTGPDPATVPGLPTEPRAARPSIENGQIGNGYPRNPPIPKTLQPTAPSLQPRDQR